MNCTTSWTHWDFRFFFDHHCRGRRGFCWCHDCWGWLGTTWRPAQITSGESFDMKPFPPTRSFVLTLASLDFAHFLTPLGYSLSRRSILSLPFSFIWPPVWTANSRVWQVRMTCLTFDPHQRLAGTPSSSGYDWVDISQVVVGRGDRWYVCSTALWRELIWATWK